MNMLDTGAPYYDTYETKDGECVSIGLDRAAVLRRVPRAHRAAAPTTSPPAAIARRGSTPSPAHRELFLTKTRDEWVELLEGTDVCFAPVLPMSEAAAAPAHRRTRHDRRARRHDPARAVAALLAHAGRDPGPGGVGGEHTDATLADWGFTADEIATLHDAGAIAQA